MADLTEKQQKALSNYMNKQREFLENENIDDELLEITLKANEMYAKAVKKYINTTAVIEFNILNHLKEKAKTFKSREELNNYLVDYIKEIKKIKEKNRIQEIELRTLVDFKKKVLQGEGKEYDLSKGIKFDYNGNEVEFDNFEFNKA